MDRDPVHDRLLLGVLGGRAGPGRASRHPVCWRSSVPPILAVRRGAPQQGLGSSTVKGRGHSAGLQPRGFVQGGQGWTLPG